MPVPTYICRNRQDAYCFRVVIPKELRDLFPNRQGEIWLSLRTHKRNDAIRLARVYAVAVDNLFRRLREGLVAKSKPELHDIQLLLIPFFPPYGKSPAKCRLVAVIKLGLEEPRQAGVDDI